MNFDEELVALGPRPQPRPGGSTWQADAEFFRRYLALFPKDSDERLRRYLDRSQARRRQGPEAVADEILRTAKESSRAA